MKIVCEACQAKYSIADDKVRGKIFKIRCKKCSHVIVVRGTGDGAMSSASGEFAAVPSSGASASPFASEASWHIVVDGEQVGPLPDSDVRARLARGEITGESFIWKEGFGDWVKVGSLPEFASAVPAAAGGFDQPAGGYGAPASSYGAPAPDPFAAFGAPAAAPAQGGDMFSSPPAAAASPMADLFSSPASALPPENVATTVNPPSGFGGFDTGASFGRGGGGNGAGAGLGAAAASNLTGQRHENSVLFSLSNLEALAKPSGGPIVTAPKPSASATTEGSGLIDIRAMAAMSLPSSDAGPSSSRPEALDLPSFAAPSIAPVAPVLLPLGQSSGPPKWMYAVLGVIGLALVVSAIVIVRLLTAPPPTVVAQAPAPAPAAAEAPPAAAKPAAAAKAEPPPETPPPAADEKLPPREEPRPAATAKADRSPGRAAAKPSGGKKPGKGEAPMVSLDKPSSPAPAPAAAPAKEPAKPKPTDDIDNLLAAATGGKKAAPAAAPEAAPRREAPAAESAAKLGREDIVRGMTPVTAKARECYAQYKVPGVVDLNITVAPSGKVTSAQAKGKFQNTPSGDCVENAAKNAAKFPANAGMSFNYPVMLR
jgi:predicted Zn finger-like uncharacterized protein